MDDIVSTQKECNKEYFITFSLLPSNENMIIHFCCCVVINHNDAHTHRIIWFLCCGFIKTIVLKPASN